MPTILTCVGTIGILGTAVSTARATTKANKLIEEATKTKGEELTKMEFVKVAGPSYITPVLFGVATAACIFGANVLNKRHQAALASAYAFVDASYKEYRNKVIELHGEETDKEIGEAIFKDNHPETDSRVCLFYDDYSKRYFESTIEDVQRAEYNFNRDFILKDYAYLNEFYELLDIPEVEDGWKLGWSTASCLEMYWQIWIDFSHVKVTLDDGRECYKVYMFQEPIEDFEDYF